VLLDSAAARRPAHISSLPLACVNVASGRAGPRLCRARRRRLRCRPPLVR
jgi:hypothetical protein